MKRLFFSVFIVMLGLITHAQGIIINLSPVDGVDLMPDNLFNFQIQSDRSTPAIIKGTVRYRSSPLYFSYTFNYNLKQGLNTIISDMQHPSWQFSSTALRELFMTYKKMPAGTYEYCVSITPTAKPNSEQTFGDTYSECVYHKSDELFIINLVDPENNAKIREYNPMLSWMVNYQFASELTYRIRVAAILNGQNPQNAITRNNPVYDERNLTGYSIMYPIYAKPLQKLQPYAWTVDAYYKGILLGGAETWKFTVIDDTVYTGTPGNMSYIDITREKGATTFTAAGQLKLKYILKETRIDTLTLRLFNESQSEIKLKGNILPAILGDNRYVINLKDSSSLKHNNIYKLIINTQSGAEYILPFNYLNPDFIK